ncbi:GNAT family N-acetyltransferase [Lutibacter oceani]|uniref:GNAT family N-acetyltransferase n=1 Tax=Lutibacter oceani TaxID=1853311 RepID=UPI0021D22DC8|nr:GNAT family N-acetyltransferase [Lutibacter oceani]
MLRKFQMEDAPAIFEFGSNAEVQKYTGDVVLKSVNEAEEIISEVLFKDYKKFGYGRWAVIYKPDNKVIGFAGLKYLPELNETDIGFRILPQYWDKGITTEVSKEIIKYGFEILKLNRIIGIVMPKNIASYKVLEKIGLKFYKFDYYESTEKYNWYKIEKADYFNQK